MKLTERQIKLRTCFRKTIINCWAKDSHVYHVALLIAFEVDGYIKEGREDFSYARKILEEMREIPSIGFVQVNVRRYLAAAYPVISEALFDGISNERAIKMFKGMLRKKTRDSVMGEEEMFLYKKSKRKLVAFGELMNNAHGSRYAKSHWGIVK